MKIRSKKLLIVITILILGLGLGYFLGYDHGFEKSVRQTKEIVATCDTEAQKKAREDLKPRYGDPVSMDLLLSSPHYYKQFNQCLNEKLK